MNNINKGKFNIGLIIGVVIIVGILFVLYFVFMSGTPDCGHLTLVRVYQSEQPSPDLALVAEHIMDTVKEYSYSEKYDECSFIEAGLPSPDALRWDGIFAFLDRSQFQKDLTKSEISPYQFKYSCEEIPLVFNLFWDGQNLYSGGFHLGSCSGSRITIGEELNKEYLYEEFLANADTSLEACLYISEDLSEREGWTCYDRYAEKAARQKDIDKALSLCDEISRTQNKEYCYLRVVENIMPICELQSEAPKICDLISRKEECLDKVEGLKRSWEGVCQSPFR